MLIFAFYHLEIVLLIEKHTVYILYFIVISNFKGENYVFIKKANHVPILAT